MEISDIKKIIEALLFVSDKPLLNREIKAVVKDELPENVKIEDIIKELQQEYVQLNRAYELKFVADGWTFATKPEYSSWIKKLLKEKTILKLSPSAMEVLAIIAYKQPITRAEIDTIRGVDCGGVIDTLTDRKFIKIVGRKETLGRPLLYGTTQEFLRHFGLSHLSELPVIEVAKDVLPSQQETAQELPFDEKLDDKTDEKKDENINVESTMENKEKDVVNSVENLQESNVNINNEEKVLNENINIESTMDNKEKNFVDSGVDLQEANVNNEEKNLDENIKENIVDVATEHLNNEQNSTEI